MKQQVIEVEDKLSKYEILETLGTGSYGTVMRAVVVKDSLIGRQVALKSVEIAKLVSFEDQQSITREMNVFIAVNKMIAENHDNGDWQRYLLRCFSIFQQENRKYFVLELAQTDLQKVIAAFSPLQPEAIQFLVGQLVLCLEQLHGIGFCHRDVKPANFLLSREGNLLLSDFGTAKQFDAVEMDMVSGACPYQQIQASGGRPRESSTFQQQSEKTMKPNEIDGPLNASRYSSMRRQSLVGTIKYAAPELTSSRCNLIGPLDIWGLGCIVFELASGAPFMREAEHSQLKKQQLDAFRQIKQQELSHFVFNLLKQDPVQRFQGGWPAIKKHRFFHGFDFERCGKLPLIRVLEAMRLLGIYARTNVTQRLPLLNQEQIYLYQKMQPWLLNFETVLFGAKAECRMDARRFKAFVVVTDFMRLIIVNCQTKTIEQEVSVSAQTFTLRQLQLEKSLLQQSQDLILVELEADQLKFQLMVPKSFYDQGKFYMRRPDHELCSQCREYAMVDGICQACGFETPFVQTRIQNLRLKPCHFPGPRALQTGERDQCEIGVYLQRKNRLYLSQDLFARLASAPVEQRTSVYADAISAQNTNCQPNYLRLTAEQNALRQLTAKLYWFSRRWSQGEHAAPLPRVSSLFQPEQLRFSEAQLTFIERLQAGCQRGVMEPFEFCAVEIHSSDAKKTKPDDLEVQLLGTKHTPLQLAFMSEGK